MQAVRLHGIGDLRFESIPRAADPTEGMMRLGVRAVGICGSDLHNYRTGRWIGRLPIVPGHEFAAEVLAVGAGVDGFAPGDRVVADSRLSCGRCAQCREGRHNTCERMAYVGEACDGGYAEEVTLPARSLLRVPAHLPYAVAALAEPLGVALRVVRRLDAPRGAPILIGGAGPIGGFAALLLDHLGYGPLYVIERNAARAQLLARMARTTNLAADPAAVAGRVGAAGLRYAIEASGSAFLFDFLVGVLAGGGRLAMVGIFDGRTAVEASAIVERELEIRGCSVYCDEQRAALEYLEPLQDKLLQLVSLDARLADLPDRFEQLLAGRSAFLKTIVQIEARNPPST